MNKMGICNLMLQRYKDARKDFSRAVKKDHSHADAYNNLGVVYYQQRDYGKAIKNYEKAVSLNLSASYYSNLGAAYFAKKQFEKAAYNYAKALELDPDIFERVSRAGVQAQLPSPDDRARYDYVLAKLDARMGVTDRSLRYLKKAMEDGYKDIGNVYKDHEFSNLRKDPRFTELMAAKTTAIPE
jgi:tetratricopeptide (TPR) repeat protein